MTSVAFVGLGHMGAPMALDTLAASPLGPVARRFRDRAARDDGPVHFPLDLAAKDLDLAVAAADRGGMELRLAAAARSRYESAMADGLGRHDMAAVVPYTRGRLATQVEEAR